MRARLTVSRSFSFFRMLLKGRSKLRTALRHIVCVTATRPVSDRNHGFGAAVSACHRPQPRKSDVTIPARQ